MAKPRAKRGRRGRGRRPLPPPGAPPTRTAAHPEATATAAAPERAADPSVTRFSARDYTYVRRELQRIALLATAIIATIVVLSFFLP